MHRVLSRWNEKRKEKEWTNVGADVHLATRQACRKAIVIMSTEIELRTFTRFRAHVSPIWKRLAKELQRLRSDTVMATQDSPNNGFLLGVARHTDPARRILGISVNKSISTNGDWYCR